MMKKQLLFLTAGIILSQPAAAMFCPSNFNQINVGDTKEEVIRQCGKPDSQTEEKSDANSPQQWQFYVKADPSDTATMNMTVAFINGKVANITANATSLTTTQLCSGNTVSLGDTADHVKAACGDPSFVQKGQGGAPSTLIEHLKYNSNPPVVLIIENGKFTKRQ